MAKAYFIGGAPRTGKTTLTLRFIKEKPILATSTDALRYTLRRLLSEEAYPDLFHIGKFTSNDPDTRAYLVSNTEKVIITQNKESSIIWESVDNFVRSNIEDGFDVLIEGIAVLPEFLDQVDYEYSAIFIGNQSENHIETILKSARENANDWMYKLDEETIRAFATFNRKFSAFIQSEADKAGLPYIEVHDDHFDDNMNEALHVLLSES